MFGLNLKKISVWLVSLVAAAYVSVAPAITEVSESVQAKDYPSCVFGAISVQMTADDVANIERQCRQAFPKAPSGAWLAWSDVGQCYDRQEYKASNRVAALALFNACSEYFL